MAWIKKDPEVVETAVEDGAVFLSLRTNFYYSLNTSGYRIWQLIEFSGNPDELTDKLIEEFEAEDGQIRKSVASFLADLEREQLVISKGGKTNEDLRERSANNSREPKKKGSFIEPELVKHDEPLHEVLLNPFDPQLPLAE